MKHNLPSGRYTGWLKQQPDQRDYKFAASRDVALSLPDAVDLTSGMGLVLDQLQLGSCGPNAEDSLILFDQHKQSLPTTGSSRLFSYYTTRQLMGTIPQDSGVDNRTMLKALAQYGFCPETLWPYDTSKYTYQPPPTVYAAALLSAVRDYAAVTQDLNSIKGCLASGYPFLFGFTVYESFETPAVSSTGLVPLPRSNERMLGGHDVCICGYDEATRLFKFKNSWGSKWGASGYGYFPYSYALDPNLSGDFWVINTIPGSPVPPVPPDPTPTPAPTQPSYTMTFSKAVRAGQLVQWRPKVNIAPGTYGAYPLSSHDEMRIVEDSSGPCLEG